MWRGSLLQTTNHSESPYTCHIPGCVVRGSREADSKMEFEGQSFTGERLYGIM